MRPARNLWFLVSVACIVLSGLCAYGVAQQGSLLRQWPQGGPPMVWSTDLLDGGSSSPVVLDGTVYVTGGREEGSLFAFNMDGRLLWRRHYGHEIGTGEYAGPRSAPVVDRDVIIVTTSLGDLYALRTDSHSELWSFNVFLRYGGKQPAGGYCATPVTHGDLVIFACGGADERTPSVVAVSRLTGDTVWTAASLPGDFGVGDGGPALVRYQGGELVVAPFCRGVLGLEPSSGRKVWGWGATGGDQSARPVCGDGLVYLPALGGRVSGTSGSEQQQKGGLMLRLTQGGGYLELWKGPPATNGQVTIMDGRLYVGDSCHDALTGRVLGRLPGVGGTIASADGLLYYLHEGPAVSLVDPAAGAMRLAGRFRPEGIGERDLMVPPVIGEGRLFLRDRNRMSVYDLRVEPESVGPRFDGGGRYPGAPPPIRWQAAKNLLWRRQLPLTGLSAPVVYRGRVFMAGELGTVVCCDAETGALEWMRDLNPMAGRAQRKRSGSGCEPIVSGERLWARSADGTVLCMGLDGTPVWATAVGPCSNASMRASLSDGVLICGGGDIVGLDAATGSERWRLRAQGLDLDVTGKGWAYDKGIVVSSAGHIIRSHDGTVISRDLPAAGAGCVVVEGSVIYTAAGSAGGYTLEAHRLPPRAERWLPIRSLWKIAGRGGNPVCLTAGEGRIFVATSDGALHMHESEKGLDVRQSGPTGQRSELAGDRQLWMVGDRVYLGAPGGTGVVDVCRSDTGEQVWSFATAEPLAGMAFDGGRLFIRTGNVLHCIGGTTPSRSAGPVNVEPVADSWLRMRGRRPIARVSPGEMPRFWLSSGPFAWQGGTDPLKSLGGTAGARPGPGDVVADGGTNRRFGLIREEKGRLFFRDSGGSRVIDLTGAAEGVALPCVYYLFTTVENMSQRWFAYGTSVAGEQRANDGALRVRSWLGGKEVRRGDLVHLPAGRIALMVEVVIEAGAVEGRRFTLAPGFLDVEKQAVESALASDAAWVDYEASASATFVLR